MHDTLVGWITSGEIDMNNDKLRDMTRKFLQDMEGGLSDDVSPQDDMLNEQGSPPQPGTGDTAQTALNSYHQLLNLLSAAEDKAKEMYQLTQAPGAGDSMASVFGGSEAGEIVGHLEGIFKAAGFADDGTTLKAFL